MTRVRELGAPPCPGVISLALLVHATAERRFESRGAHSIPLGMRKRLETAAQVCRNARNAQTVLPRDFAERGNTDGPQRMSMLTGRFAVNPAGER